MTSTSKTPIYFDNAATTPLLPEVMEAMHVAMISNFGNPSSVHQLGRKAKSALETARKTIASLLSCESRQIVFTSSGTEANNLAIKSAYTNGVRYFISSLLEHSCVIQSLKALESKDAEVSIRWLKPNQDGGFSDSEIDSALASKATGLVCLMHANNEIGNFYNVEEITQKAKKRKYQVLSDMVQTIGHYDINFKELDVDFASCSAHKFHGPKGVGFLYVKEPQMLKADILGGGQERGYRSGTENLVGIVGMTKALEVAIQNLKENQEKVAELKNYLIERLLKDLKIQTFNGLSGNLEESLYNLVSFQLGTNSLLSFQLDMQGVAISQGSACQSGASKASETILNLYEKEPEGTTLRVSFSHLNTKEEIDRFLLVLRDLSV